MAAIREAQIVVNAEGTVAQLPVTEPAQVGSVGRRDRPGTWATAAPYERFTRDGPLALLPVPGTAEGGRSDGLVWCMPSERRRATPGADR